MRQSPEFARHPNLRPDPKDEKMPTTGIFETDQPRMNEHGLEAVNLAGLDV